jgi:hypothetical protein
MTKKDIEKMAIDFIPCKGRPTNKIKTLRATFISGYTMAIFDITKKTMFKNYTSYVFATKPAKPMPEWEWKMWNFTREYNA